jgi:hypothetical protein
MTLRARHVLPEVVDPGLAPTHATMPLTSPSTLGVPDTLHPHGHDEHGATGRENGTPTTAQELHAAHLSDTDSTQGSLDLGADAPAGAGATDSTPAGTHHPALAEASDKHQPDCALCGLKARMWSGVTDWMDELGRWIGWCSKECQNRWLRSDASAHRRRTE